VGRTRAGSDAEKVSGSKDCDDGMRGGTHIGAAEAALGPAAGGAAGEPTADEGGDEVGEAPAAPVSADIAGKPGGVHWA